MSAPRTAFITGASSGFGAEIAAGLARRGWRVIASMRNPERADGLKSVLRRESVPESSVSIVQLDVTVEDSRRRAVSQVLETAGAPDLVLHCAGYTTAGFFEDLSSQAVRDLLETNFFGAVELTRALLPSMRERGTGTVAVVTSNACNIAHPMYSMYAASKWALEGWAEALDIELAPFGISVQILQPGNHDTGFGANVQLVDPSPAYAALQSAALERMARLGERARSAAQGADEMCDALDAPTGRLRTRIGRDDKAMAALARFAPYAVRRALIRKITGITAESAKA